jgi:hypothetical protein
MTSWGIPELEAVLCEVGESFLLLEGSRKIMFELIFYATDELFCIFFVSISSLFYKNTNV